MTQRYKHTQNTQPPAKLLPLATMMLAGSLSATPAAMAQTQPEEKTLTTVTVKDKAEADIAEGKNSVRTTETRIGKGKQALRDIPQSVTVVTEKLIDDRNLDTFKEALKNTAGISFLAAEGGEEDIRLRGFSLQATGDVFVDSVRDPAFYERDTFNLDRLEVLRGSASMLFGRGSTGGAVNQVSKTPRLMDENQVDLTLGSHKHVRLVGDFNQQTGESAALRLNVMKTQADNNGSGSSLDKEGIAGAYRWGIGEKDEFQVGLYHLNNQNGMNYGMPWIRPSTTSSPLEATILPLDPTAYYGMASDYNAGSATHLTASHTHRFSADSELKTQIRKGQYERDQRAGTVRFANAASQPGGQAVSLATLGPNTVINRGTNLKIQDMDTLHVQSDFSKKFQALGLKHELLAGFDLATEDKTVYAARTAGAQGGVNLTKPSTTIGTPNDGAWRDESTRVLRVNNQYSSTGWGAYLQDLVQVAPQWKVLGGLRYDSLKGDYDQFGNPTNATDNGAKTRYRMKVGEWSQRAGVLFQPSDLQSFHLSYGTSFNTSGDTYSLGAANADTPPEQSENWELGAKLDSADKRFTTRLALFRATKKNERNTDPLLPVVTLTGSRYASGLEIDVAGRLTPKWEVFGSFTWMPDAKVSKAAPCPATGACSQGAAGERVGDRPALTPVHSGSAWTTYQVSSQWRVGGGVTFRGRQTPTRSEFEVRSFVVGDLMAEYTYSDALSFKANVSNVTNKLYADQLYPGHYIPGAGRLTQITASYKF
ncbi:TonB-dependent receptor [Limnohabitans sp. 63ED37-2]|uniref:TonB-dependent receptor n=1 Tax=Limnohabitans sp. 63ED37-2 TaxID=1678128 RepID=UPI000705A05B|nr:TonB-dependent siderophore receptor [Limnohabitans sp. 63ED37-2]ALK88283.1 putative TonB-dependent receptor BfrD precursor [Limnohabitans sp. 63ED37-2]